MAVAGGGKKKEEKLDWMYSGATVNREEYLLGKKIDRHVEKEDTDDLKVQYTLQAMLCSCMATQ